MNSGKKVQKQKIILKIDFNNLKLFYRYAILDEVWRLVDNKIVTVEDIDKVISEGLGMRYAFLGSLETAHLNAEGMKSYIDRLVEN